MTGMRSRMSTSSSFSVGGNERDDCGALGGGISGASESFVAWLLADLPHLIGGGIVGSMPLSRTQQETADLFQAAGVQESCHTHTPARLTSAQRSAAAVSRRKIAIAPRAAERPFQRAQASGRRGAGPAFCGYLP